jgi:endonuclease/exonuclease/phosphatase family metal-dependent hydrolase
MTRRAALILWTIPLSAISALAVEIRVATFNIGAHFGETYFDYSLGDPGTPDHDSVREVLRRLDADVVCLQEIHSADLQGSPNDLAVLASSLGYPYLHVPPVTGAIDTTFRVVLFSRFPFLTTESIGSPPGAKELTRLHPVVRIDVPGTHNDPVLVSAHLKAGTSLSDRFRRAVEMLRLTGYLSAAGLTDEDNFIVLGDFNPSSTDATFTAEPSGLPDSYMLGNDMAFPVTYSVDPIDYFTTPAALKLDPRQMDGSPSTFDTGSSGGPTLDRILISPAIARRPVATEIYNSALDVSSAEGLPKAGAPLAAATSATASDHYAVFADLELDSAESYVFSAAGVTVEENFTGFMGAYDPVPWTTTGGSVWRGIDDGASTTPGWRFYGTAGNTAPGFLADGAPGAMSATFRNYAAVPLTALEVALDAGQWRAVMNGAADSLRVDLVSAGQTIPMPGLAFNASQSLPTGPVNGGAVTRLSAIASGLWIPPGDSFALRVSFVPGDNGGPAPNDVFVNEFHYDNADTDSGEFVEIAVAPGFRGNLSDVSLIHYNGGNGGTNGTYNLGSFAPGATTASGHRLFYKMISGLQNDTEGFAVVVGSNVLHFISYEGSFTATNGPAAGMTSTDIGVFQNGAEPVGQAALGLTGSGGGAADFTWRKFDGIAHSPGQPNAGQAFANPNAPPQGLGFDNLSVTFLTDQDLDGLPDAADPDDDNDGLDDAGELAFGTDPLDAASRFAPVIARAAAPRHGLELSFPGASGVIYTVQTSVTLGAWQDLSTHVGGGQPIVVPLPMAEPRMFFRVRAGGP